MMINIIRNNSFLIKLFLLFSFSFILLITLVIYQSPLLLLLTMFFFSIIPILQFSNWIPAVNISNKANEGINNCINLLKISGILELAEYHYNWLNNKLTYSQFKIYAISVNAGFLGYILLTRYIFYLKLNIEPISWFIIFFHFLTSCCLLLRACTSFSWYIIPLVYSRLPYVNEPNINNFDEIPTGHNTGTPPNVQNNYGGFMPRHNHTHSHHYPPMPPKSNLWRNCGLTIGVLGLCGSAFACYTYHYTRLASERQADAAAVSAGVISKETYYERHPSDRPR